MREIFKVVVTIVLIVAVLAIVGRIFLFDISKVSNYSMVPNIIPGDIFAFRTVGLLGAGDIAVCKNPEDPSNLITGRIIGVPGDEVSIKNNNVIINTNMVHHNFTHPVIYFDTSTEESMKYVVHQAEEKVAGSLFTVSLMETSRGKKYRPVVVPQDSFFLLGDNRNMAHDSRNYGFVPIENCKGEAMFIIWAAETNGDLKQSDRYFSWL